MQKFNISQKTFLALLTFMSITGLVSCTNSKIDPQIIDGILVKNITAIDVKNGSRPNVDIAINDGKITLVNEANQTHSTYSQTIDGSGKFLIPGLWDAHVHLAYIPELDHNTFYPLSLAYGVTSLRDTGGHIDKLTEARKAAQSPTAPSLYISGPLIDGANRIYDGSTPQRPDLSVGAGSIEEAERIVDELASHNVDFLKAYEMLKPEVFKAVTTRAEKHGLKVAAHTPLSMTTYEAITAGANDMQHFRNIEFDCASNAAQIHKTKLNLLDDNDAPSPGHLRTLIHNKMRSEALAHQDENACANVISALADAEVFQTPTLGISRFLTRKLFADPEYRASFSLLPLSIGEAWKKRSAQYVNVRASPTAQKFDQWIMETIPKMHKAGVPLMAGTDAPIGFLTPGASLHEELKEFVAAGLSPLEAIGTATYTPAKFMKLEKEVGLIEEGMRADLVLLSQNPLENIDNIASIDAVIIKGNLLDRAVLDEKLNAPSQFE